MPEKRELNRDLSSGSVTGTLLLFAAPMMLGNLLQQCYNLADTLIVGRFLGADALAAVGSAYTLMTFLTSILIGLCMGCGAVLSVSFGQRDMEQMRQSSRIAFVFIGLVTLLLNVLVFAAMRPILRILQVPREILPLMREYVRVIFCGIIFVFLYNFFAYLLRAVGNSAIPLVFLGVSSVLNIVLDLVFVVAVPLGVAGAALATVLSQAAAGAGIGIYALRRLDWLRGGARKQGRRGHAWAEIIRNSVAACIQQSVMNFGILMIQGLVNSFGVTVMAAFAAAVKIDTIAYMPAQEFANAFSLFTSQNHGAGKRRRVLAGMRSAAALSVGFCLAVSAVIFALAPVLMRFFVDAGETEIIRTGVGYLRVEGAFYCGIGLLFLLYGFYRGVKKPEMSLVLTVISLGTRVLLAYTMSSAFGVAAIWWAIPIGWFLADVTGIACIRRVGGYEFPAGNRRAED